MRLDTAPSEVDGGAGQAGGAGEDADNGEGATPAAAAAALAHLLHLLCPVRPRPAGGAALQRTRGSSDTGGLLRGGGGLWLPLCQRCARLVPMLLHPEQSGSV